MQPIEIDRLITDFTIYPRVTVDKQHVGYMIASLEAGVDLPPIVIDKKSFRIVDGFHRVEAVKRCKMVKKPKIISAIFKSYKDQKSIFIDAIKYNAGHGRALTQYDRAHCCVLGQELSISGDALASAMNITVEKLGKLKIDRVGKLHVAIRGKCGRSKKVPLKRTIQHMAGKTLSVKQGEVNEKLSGMNQKFYVNQIIMLIESDLLDLSDSELIEKLRRLKTLIEKIV